MDLGEIKSEKAYQACLLWSTPLQCNFSCSYCITQVPHQRHKKKGKLTRIREKFFPVPETIDADRLTATLDKTGLTFLIIFSGGEPFLVPNMIDACRKITKKHFVNICTNLTSPRVIELIQSVDPERISFKASFHFKEIHRLGLFDQFVKNAEACRAQKFQLDIKMVGHPGFIDESLNARELLRRRGFSARFAWFIGTFQGRTYPRDYRADELAALELDTSDCSHREPEGKNCIAGYRFAYVSMDGSVRPCPAFLKSGPSSIDLGNVYSELKLRKTALRCPFSLCTTPPYQLSKLGDVA